MAAGRYAIVVGRFYEDLAERLIAGAQAGLSQRRVASLIGRLDEDGFLFVTGRLKEVMVTASGETLHPEELEPYYASPLFAEHCVVPVRGRQGNDVPTLVIVPARGETTPQELEETFARLRASAPARCRVAKLVRLSAPLPRTALGVASEASNAAAASASSPLWKQLRPRAMKRSACASG